MIPALDIFGLGAVTPVGLDAAQSCAAIRAGLKRFTAIETPLLPGQEPRIGARISAAPGLRRGEDEWLLNLAARAIRECCSRPKFVAEETALFLLIPEAHRGHLLSAREDREILQALCGRLELGFAERSKVFRGGAGALFQAIGEAGALIGARAVKRCVIGGADSLLRLADLERLAAVGRLHRPEVPQGVVPGEAAAFVLLGPRSKPKSGAAGKPKSKPKSRVAIRGVGVGYERAAVIDGGSSVGDGLVAAFEGALLDAELPEAELDFVAGNFNGERYDAWECAHAHARCFRTRREHLPVMWPAASVGETGVAGTTLALIAAATAIEQGHAPGKTGVVEGRSEGEARGVAILR